LRFGVGSKQGRKNGDIEALADAMRALKKMETEKTTATSVITVLKVEY
jgi:hypothetical protein